MTYIQLLTELEKNGDTKFADFSKTLSNSTYKVFGVKNPNLRKIVKDHLKDDELKLEDFKLGEHLEVDFIYFSLGITRLKTNQEKLQFLKEKIRFAKSWAITDCVCTYFKKLTFAEYYPFFLELHKSKYKYDRRIAYVLGLKLYKEKDILKILSLLNANEEYMVMMAEAWLLATIAITYPEEVYDFLKETKDVVLKRKTISKISDSFRFDEKTKNKFKNLRNP